MNAHAASEADVICINQSEAIKSVRATFPDGQQVQGWLQRVGGEARHSVDLTTDDGRQVFVDFRAVESVEIEFHDGTKRTLP